MKNTKKVRRALLFALPLALGFPLLATRAASAQPSSPEAPSPSLSASAPPPAAASSPTAASQPAPTSAPPTAAAAPPPAAPTAGGQGSAVPEAPKGSLATMAPLGKGRIGMSLGGGLAVLLPFYVFEAGYGLGRVDIVGRFESVVGVLHYPSVGVRWSPLDIGAWKLGLAFATNYSFFGIKTGQVNLTSTFYLTGEIGISGPVTKLTDLVFAVSNEVDLFDYRSLDGESTVRGSFHYDAAVFRAGIKTRLTEDLDGYARARVRVPVETLRYEAVGLYVVPFIEIGGTFSF